MWLLKEVDLTIMNGLHQRTIIERHRRAVKYVIIIISGSANNESVASNSAIYEQLSCDTGVL